MTLKISAVVPSVKRHDALVRLVDALLSQTQPLSQLVVSVPDEAVAIPAQLRGRQGVAVVTSGKGASRQRNTGVAALDADTDVVVFLDDDSVPRDDYVAQVEAVFSESQDVIAMTGRMARDGAAEKIELTPAEITSALEASHDLDGVEQQETWNQLYGCNMAIRYADVVATPFDEELPLYSWLEDLDVARRLAKRGRLVRDPRCVVAHQGNASGGRTQHIRFGYSSVANPIYLLNKGSLRWADLAPLIVIPVLGNLRGLLSKESDERRERLRGQFMALTDLPRRRMTPARITEI